MFRISPPRWPARCSTSSGASSSACRTSSAGCARSGRSTRSPFYASVDLRNAGFKLAPVDTNLFPGGFNNLNPSFLPLCVQAAQGGRGARVPRRARRAADPREPHAQHRSTCSNVATLEGILRQAGMRVRIGTLNPGDRAADQDRARPTASTLTLEPIERNGRRVGVDDFDPCMVLLNNDLSAGPPDILREHRPAGRAAAAGGLVQPPQVAPLRRL